MKPLADREKPAEPVYIHTFGGFSLRRGQNQIADRDGRNRKVWLLLEYLLVNRDRECSSLQLGEVIRGRREERESPQNPLKNLVYRARALLKALSPGEETEYILSSPGAYRWNREIPCVADWEEFETCAGAGADPALNVNARIDACLTALSLYKGEFLPKSAQSDWASGRGAFYASLYKETAERAAVLLEEEGRWEDLVRVCEAAAARFPFEEEIHCKLLRALAASGQQRKALLYYDRLADLFYKERGAALSARTRALCREIRERVGPGEGSMAQIEEELREDGPPAGAMACDYETFKELCRFQARALRRTGTPALIALLTIRDPYGQVPGEKILKDALGHLRGAALESLGPEDVVSVYSPSQIVLLLPAAALADGEKLVGRIINRYERRRPRDTRIDCSLRETGSICP